MKLLAAHTLAVASRAKAVLMSVPSRVESGDLLGWGGF